MSISTAGAVMDDMYRHQRRIYDATRAYYLLGRDQLIQKLAASPGMSVLEIACGTARNLLRTADLYPGTALYGIDISSEMLTTARAAVGRSRHKARIVLDIADATRFDPQELFGIAAADRIIISYAASMIPHWENAIDEALRHVAPGGSLHIVDFGSMTGMPPPVRRALLAWLSKFGVKPRHTLEAVCAAAAGRYGATSTFQESPRGYWCKAVITRV